MHSKRTAALMLLPDWARRLSSRVGLSFAEELFGGWRRRGGEAEGAASLALQHTAESARGLLEDGAMRTRGTVTLSGLADDAEVSGSRRVHWPTGQVDLELKFRAADGTEFRLLGGRQPLRAPGADGEPFRFHVEAQDGTRMGEAVFALAAGDAPETEAHVRFWEAREVG